MFRKRMSKLSQPLVQVQQLPSNQTFSNHQKLYFYAQSVPSLFQTIFLNSSWAQKLTLRATDVKIRL